MNTIKILSDISPRNWEHPADRGALAALRSMKGFDTLVKTVFGMLSERPFRLLFMANAVKVSPTQFPAVHKAAVDASETLGMKSPPEIFVSQNPILNAGAYGFKEPFIVINSSLVKILDPAELQVLVGHETGHILSGHAVYRTLLAVLVNISAAVLPLPGFVLMALKGAFLDWARKSEFSADRAGLLASQDADACYRLLMKLAGGSDIGQMSVNDFFEQAEEYERNNEAVDQLFKMLNIMNQTHPFAVIRLRELKLWADTPEYQRILDGDYMKASDDNPRDPFEDLKSAGAQWSKDAKNAPNISDTIESLGATVTEVAEEIGGAFKEMFNFQGTERNETRKEDDEE